jgi:hypothetical protein
MWDVGFGDHTSRIEIEHDTMGAAGRDFDSDKLHGESLRQYRGVLQAR